LTEPRTSPTGFDLVVYGATAGGIIAATAAARLGMRVALAEPSEHVGGMVSGGLARSDVERQERLIGGLAREFFAQVGRRYGSPQGSPLVWRFEPKVAELVLREWLDDAGVALRPEWRLARVERSDGRIRELVSDSGDRLGAPCFVDATYEGDLLAGAGVSYAVGRDGRSRYGESLAGRLELLPNPHQFAVPISALAPDGGLLPCVQPYESIGSLGHGDGKTQSYCYRLCLTEDPEQRVPFPEPPGYDPDRYLLVRRYLAALGDSAVPRDFMGLGRLPNGKLDINSDGPVSTNLLGASWGYAEADADRRREIAGEHRQWAQGLLFFLSNDASVPESLRRRMRRLGIPADEFPRTGHWPPQLYVREARRMVGEQILTQRDVQAGPDQRVPDAIGMGGYNIDIREVQWVAAPISRFPDVHAEVLTEGYLSVPVDPYPVPYRALLPRRDECANLLVSACVSASHVAFASFRMEPQFMIAGHAAGVAAALAVDTDTSLHDIDVSRLQTILRAQGQVLEPR
jgi:hypothetical protein